MMLECSSSFRSLCLISMSDSFVEADFDVHGLASRTKKALTLTCHPIVSIPTSITMCIIVPLSASDAVGLGQTDDQCGDVVRAFELFFQALPFYRLLILRRSAHITRGSSLG